MKNNNFLNTTFVTLLILLFCEFSFAQTETADYYNVKSGVGKGVRMWSSDNYKIHMGNTSLYKYGPVTNYSIKMNMSNHSTRGWTWGVNGKTPVTALNTKGNFQTQGWVRSMDSRYYFGNNQNLYGDNSSALYFTSNNSNITQFIMRDKENNIYGNLYGSGNGANFGLLDGDGDWSYLAAKDDYTAFRINDNEKMRITTAGNVGIGTTTPLSKLSVGGNGDARFTASFYLDSPQNGGRAVHAVSEQPVGTHWVRSVFGEITSGRGYAIGVEGRSNSAKPSAAGRSYGGYFIGGNATKGANFGMFAEVRGSNSGAAVLGWNKVGYPNGDGHNPTGTVPQNIHYGGYFIGKGYFSDNVGIGVRDPQNKLDVCGTIRGNEVKVESGWCDYVFSDDYIMPTLAEEAKHIKENGHLLSFESAEDMEGEIQLGDVTKRQQETIEKLMLHMIEMDKEIKALKAQIENQ